jgi:DEAD/DEAH box helicase domain-containing protein
LKPSQAIQKKEKKYASVEADVLIVTPEQLHACILPHHSQWKAFLGALHSVILDDCQEYRGLFGSHVGLVLRRLQRIILSYRETLPHFLLASALIGNPKEHAEHLLGQAVEVIDAARDGSAFAGCLHLLWQPPNSTPFADEAARLLALFIRQGYRVVVFAQARQAVERIVNRAREDLPQHLREQVRPYRGGYDLSERVEMEEKLISGQLQGIVSTRALEVGLEMGVVDVAIIAGFPGSLISYVQQAGRAGRQIQSALCVFVPRPDALDASFMAQPERLWQGATEPLWLNTHNQKVLSAHLRCAAAELPLSIKDQHLFGSQMLPVIRTLVEDHHLIEQGDSYFAFPNIAGEVPLRHWGAEVVIQLGDRTERTDRYHALIECYPGAVYYSHGVSYSVTHLDQKRDRISAERCNLPYDTKPILETQVEILQEVRRMEDGPFQWIRGKVRVTQHVTGLLRQARKSKSVLGREYFPQSYSYAFETNALWITFADQFLKRADPKRLYPVLHAVEHGWLASCPLLIQGDRHEMNGVSVTPCHPDTKRASIFLYEESHGGNGYGERIYPHVRALTMKTLSQLEACSCSNGCHLCIQKPYCHYFKEPIYLHLHRQGQVVMLEEGAAQQVSDGILSRKESSYVS